MSYEILTHLSNHWLNNEHQIFLTNFWVRRSRSQRFFKLHEYDIWTQAHTTSTVDSTVDRIEHCYLKRLRCLKESACKKLKVQICRQCESNLVKIRNIKFEWSRKESVWSYQQQIFDSIQQAHTFEYVSKCVYDWIDQLTI